jgi:hypothetical protein
VQETTRLVALRRYAAILTIFLCLLAPSAAFSQGAPDTPAPTSAEPAGDSWGESGQPDNFVRSKGPAKEGHAYNWLQMVYAGGVMLVMVGFMVWLVRRTPSKRVADQGAQE